MQEIELTKQLNDVLNFWHIGYSGSQIAQHTGLTKRRVYRIVQSAQEHGDERAAPHRIALDCKCPPDRCIAEEQNDIGQTSAYKCPRGVHRL